MWWAQQAGEKRHNKTETWIALTSEGKHQRNMKNSDQRDLRSYAPRASASITRLHKYRCPQRAVQSSWSCRPVLQLAAHEEERYDTQYLLYQMRYCQTDIPDTDVPAHLVLAYSDCFYTNEPPWSQTASHTFNWTCQLDISSFIVTAQLISI